MMWRVCFSHLFFFFFFLHVSLFLPLSSIFIFSLLHFANLLTYAGFETIVLNYGTDIPGLKGDHKRYLYGPGDYLVTHSDHEHLSVSDLEEAVEGYKVLITNSLK